jgi:RNA polymerase sigma-70 factor (ECF subfamily)
MFEIYDPMIDATENNTPSRTEVLWRMHADELLRFATVLVGPSDAPDIVTDAFLRSEKALVSGRVDNARAYLFRAVANHAHDLRRSRERRWARDLAAIGPASSSAPDSHVDVRRAVSGLSVQQRAVVYFAYWEDLAERDIADVMEISPGSVRRHLTRARHHLRKALS